MSTVMGKIHHIGIVVEKLDRAYGFYRETLGLPLIKEAEVRDQGVRAALLAAGESEIELLEPIASGTGVQKFLEKRGEGLHHLCFQTLDVGAALASLKARAVSLIDQSPRPGLAGMIAFLHPKSCAGILVELATPVDPHSRLASPLGLKRLVIGARDPKETARIFQALFELSERAMDGAPRIMLAVGQSALLVVPAEEAGGNEGMVALSLLAEDLGALVGRLEAAGVSMLRGAGEVTVAPASAHGVHLHISRFA
jgi:methylmalonyl-CoA/ethylmalonyl-CoA epimerase